MASELEVVVKETEPATVSFIEMKGPFSQIGSSMGRLYTWISQNNYIPAGPPSGVYFNSPSEVPEEELRWELRAPVLGSIPETRPDEDGLGVKRTASTLVVSTMHHGSYEEVGKTYGAAMAWINTNGYEVIGPPEEVYLTNPGEADSENLMTEIRLPVRKTS